jgi:phage-related minor tail protein
MSFLDSTNGASGAGADLTGTLDGLQSKTNNLGISVGTFASAMTRAFAQATTGGKQFDDVLKSLALRLSNLTVQQAFKPLAKDFANGLNSILNGVFGTGTSGNSNGITPFAAGGVIGAPSYFPLSNGGLGLAGEAGPEAIVPLARGPDGRLGVSLAGPSQPANVTVQIATPDAASFRRSEAYITGQIARAVARGQRSL